MDRPGEMLLLATEGDAPPSAVVRVNRPASLLALSTNGPALHILADPAGFELLAQPLPPLLANLRCGALTLRAQHQQSPGTDRAASILPFTKVVAAGLCCRVRTPTLLAEKTMQKLFRLVCRADVSKLPAADTL